MNAARFFALAWRDAEERIARLTAPVVAQDAGLWDLLDDSQPGRAASRLSRAIKRSAGQSQVVWRWRAAAQTWRSCSSLSRIRAVGLFCMAAAATHIALGWPQRTVGGWWLILPGIVIAFGGAAVTLSWITSPKPQDRR